MPAFADKKAAQRDRSASGIQGVFPSGGWSFIGLLFAGAVLMTTTDIEIFSKQPQAAANTWRPRGGKPLPLDFLIWDSKDNDDRRQGLVRTTIHSWQTGHRAGSDGLARRRLLQAEATPLVPSLNMTKHAEELLLLKDKRIQALERQLAELGVQPSNSTFTFVPPVVVEKISHHPQTNGTGTQAVAMDHDENAGITAEHDSMAHNQSAPAKNLGLAAQSQQKAVMKGGLPVLPSKPVYKLTQMTSKGCQDNCSAATCAQVKRSTLHSVCCQKKGLTPTPTQKWPLIISATPRSGTVATQQFLSSLGLAVHSDWGNPTKDGIVSWIHIFSEFDVLGDPSNTVSQPYFGPGRLNGGRFDVALHLVRDPLLSVTSVSCTEPVTKESYQTYIRRHIRIPQQFVKQRNKLAIGMKMWLEWHRFLDSLCVPRFRLEDLFDAAKTRQVVDEIFKTIGRSPPTEAQINAAMHKGGKKTNSRKHRPTVTWKELLMVDRSMAREILELAKSYGYAETTNVDLDALEAQIPTDVKHIPDCVKLHPAARRRM